MTEKPFWSSAFFGLRILIGLPIFLTAFFLALFSRANPQVFGRYQPRYSHGDTLVPAGIVHEAWVARYKGPASNNDAAAIAVDNSGNVYVTGVSNNGSGVDYATVKYDSAGQEQWAAVYNGPANGTDAARAIAIDGSGNVYVTGQSDGGGFVFDYATVKYDALGQQQWVARYNGPGNGNDFASAIAVDSLGKVYVTGFSLGSGTDADYATIKYDALGQQQWVARHNGPTNQYDEATSLTLDSLGNVYVTGLSWGQGTRFDYATVKYNTAGQQEWITRYDGLANGIDQANAITVDGSGNVYVTGESDGISADYATIKYNSSGQEQWVARYNGPQDGIDRGKAIAVDGMGNVGVTGVSGHSGVTSDYATIKYNAAGQEQWAVRYNGPGNEGDAAAAIAVDSSGSFYVTGTSQADYTTIKYDTSGQEQWLARYDGPESFEDAATAIALDSSGNVYVTGTSPGKGDFHAYATIKYVQGSTPTPTPKPTATATPSATPSTSPTPTPTTSPPVTPTPTTTPTFTATPTTTPASTPRSSPTPRFRPTPMSRPTPS